MKLFAKGTADKLTPKQEALADRIAGRIRQTQCRLAEWLNGKTAGLTAKNWLWLLVLFSLGFGAYCLYLLVSAFN
ncbi:hypothetical protein [Pararcticibacter amylolyticus]|uniref:Uncharacterized protein n=1 Tax=Pararcticibacter amylolyticus TaxID=2173175 RepID=A0A2U2PI30_9SPHI|nr:hypothetical protein [Pararcticibacter amylolyticus]PWG80799.1 hypothetical protein DDR33_10100 [Pararcticibacter amylolyticus]